MSRFRLTYCKEASVLCNTICSIDYFSFTVITELGNSAKGYCELSGRVEPVVSDVVMALINMGKPCIPNRKKKLSNHGYLPLLTAKPWLTEYFFHNELSH